MKATDRPAPREASPRLVNCGISARGIYKVKPSDGSDDFARWLANEPVVVGARIHRNDVEVIRGVRDGDKLAERLEGTRRGVIETLSKESRRRLALAAANTRHDLRSFITVTYPNEFPCDGKIVKEHLKKLLDSLRRFAPEKLHYLWFLEFQRRGAPHFHVFTSADLPKPLTTLRRTLRDRDAIVNASWQRWISRRWFEIVGSKDRRHLAAGACWERVQKADGAARYVAKEASKTFQKSVPKAFQNVGRFWGTSRGFMPDEVPSVRVSASMLRQVFGESCHGGNGEPYPVIYGGAERMNECRKAAKRSMKTRLFRDFPEKSVKKTRQKGVTHG